MNPDHADETIIAQPNVLANVLAFAVDPDDRKALYVAARQSPNAALFLSRDFGTTWQELNRLPEVPQKMWIDPRSPRDSRTIFLAGPHFMTIKNSPGLQNLPTTSEF